MHKPNYKHSIVNITASILDAIGKPTGYTPLPELPQSELQKKNLVLLLIDGLGYEFLRRKGENSILLEFLRSKLTSVFPPTTAAAITSFLTGVPPNSHAVTGWFMYLKELGAISTILPFTLRGSGVSLTEVGISPSKIFNIDSIFSKIYRKSYIVSHKDVIFSPYSKYFSKKSKPVPFSDINDYFYRIKKTVLENNDEKFIYAYWSEFDHICHECGIDSTKAQEHFKTLSSKISELIESLKGTETTVIITADHGLIDADEFSTIYLKDHPELKEMLLLPFAGDPRSVYCYLKSGKENQFENYIAKHLSEYCWLFKSRELISKNFYGISQNHPQLEERIGDYVLVMKKNYVFKDFISGEEFYFNIGNHGGVSKEEMFVPLIVMNP